MKPLVYAALFWGSLLWGEVLDTLALKQLLETNNRHLIILEQENRVEEAQAASYQGVFDVAAIGKFERKEYPQSSSEYRELGLAKGFESGAVLEAKYRYAQGQQEYNNIKTGDEGEYQLGLHLPILELYEGSNKNRYRLDQGVLKVDTTRFGTSDKVRRFYFDTFKKYYTMLMLYHQTKRYKNLVSQSIKRENFIRAQVSAGRFAPIVIEDAKAMTASYQEQRLETLQKYLTQRYELCYLLDKECRSLDAYSLPDLPHNNRNSDSVEEMLSQALERRSDLKVLQTQQQQLALEQSFITTQRAAKSALGIYTVYDPLYYEGYKVTLDVDIPLQQRHYESRHKKILQQSQQIDHKLALQKFKIKNKLKELMDRSRYTKEQIVLVQEQTARLQKVVDATHIKFTLGSASLVELNQQETRLLKVSLKALQKQLDLLLIETEMKVETGAIVF